MVAFLYRIYYDHRYIGTFFGLLLDLVRSFSETLKIKNRFNIEFMIINKLRTITKICETKKKLLKTINFALRKMCLIFKNDTRCSIVNNRFMQLLRKVENLRVLHDNELLTLSRIMSLLSFHSPWKHQKTKDLINVFKNGPSKILKILNVLRTFNLRPVSTR